MPFRAGWTEPAGQVTYMGEHDSIGGEIRHSPSCCPSETRPSAHVFRKQRIVRLVDQGMRPGSLATQQGPTTIVTKSHLQAASRQSLGVFGRSVLDRAREAEKEEPRTCVPHRCTWGFKYRETEAEKREAARCQCWGTVGYNFSSVPLRFLKWEINLAVSF